MFCEVSHFYSMPYRDLMAIPIKTFWLLSGNIRRIRAGDDLRRLSTAAAAQSAEGVRECQDRLIIEIGEVIKEPSVAEAVRDEVGFAELKLMAATM